MDKNGLVEAVGVGETTITVTVDGVSDTANVNVEEPESGEGD